jgi:hypothetical protein
MSRKLKDIFHCKKILGESLYPLQIWYNNLIEKTVDEITIFDILRMLRQKVFIELAMNKALEYLRQDVFIGEQYDGQMIEEISKMNTDFLKLYVEDLIIILNGALEKSKLHEWSYNGEKEEFDSIVNELMNRLLHINRLIKTMIDNDELNECEKSWFEKMLSVDFKYLLLKDDI